MPDGKSVRSTCLEFNFNPNDSGTMCLNRSETPTSVGYDMFAPNWAAQVNACINPPYATSVPGHRINHSHRHKAAALRHGGDPIENAFLRCWRLGWIPSFEKAAEAFSFTPELLIAIAFRESSLDPKYLSAAGDNGHGYGLMQVDIRSYPDWVKAGNWKDAGTGIQKGAEVLASKRDEIQSSVGKTLTVHSLAGKTYHFQGKAISGDDLTQVTIAAYNCGRWAYYHYSKGHDVDQGTTGKNYSRDVLSNMPRFKQLLDRSSPHVVSDLDFSHLA